MKGVPLGPPNCLSKRHGKCDQSELYNLSHRSGSLTNDQENLPAPSESKNDSESSLLATQLYEYVTKLLLEHRFRQLRKNLKKKRRMRAE